MSVRKVKKARRLVTGLAKEMQKKGDTSSSTTALAKRADRKPLSAREKYTVAKRVVANQAKKSANIKSQTPMAPSTRKAVVEKTIAAGRAGGLGGKKTTKLFEKKQAAAQEKNSNKITKATPKGQTRYVIKP